MNKLKSILWIQVIAFSLFVVGCDSFGGLIGGEADLSKLEGTWVRVESNNPVNDFMKIEVVGNTGTVVDDATSGFNVGDVKWQTISPNEGETFTHSELGSDYNYYDGTITIVNDDELSISVNNSGAGNTQKWLRDDGSIVPTKGETLECNGFNVARTLANGPAAVDYIVPSGCVLNVTAALTIEPGTVIEFEENAGIGIYDNGTINAVGTETAQIVLRGAQNVAGYWRGIHTETNSLTNRLEYVTIQNAGSNYVYCCNQVATVFVKDGKMAFKDVTITDGEGHGIYAKSSAEFSAYENVTISSHKLEPLAIAPNLIQYLDGTNSDYSGNDEDYVRILVSRLNEAVTAPANNVPYLLEGKVFDITEPMIVEAGAEFVVEENGGIGIFDEGSLTIQGTAANPVIIRGKQSVAGYWRGIHLETNKIANKFEYLQLSEAGGDYVYCCNPIASIYFKDGNLSLSNITVSNGDNYGIYVNTNARFGTYSSNTINTHNDFPLSGPIAALGDLDGTESNYTGNNGNKDFIEMRNSQLSDPMTLKKTNVPYWVPGAVVDIKEAFTMEPGVEIVFAENGGLGVYDQGTLNAEGTAAAPIIFRGSENIQGYWRGIHVETNSGSNVFNHVTVDNAGSNYVYCCNDKAGLFLRAGQFTVENSTFSNSGGCGIYVRSGATLTESGNTFSNNADGNICN